MYNLHCHCTVCIVLLQYIVEINILLVDMYQVSTCWNKPTRYQTCCTGWVTELQYRQLTLILIDNTLLYYKLFLNEG